MASNVFGKPITSSTLEGLPEYTGMTITRAHRAAMASNTKNAENKDVAARRYVDELRKAWGGDDIFVLCMVYNATGNTITFATEHDWEGCIAQAPYPVEISNGQWGAFLHKHRGGGGSHGAVVYRLKGDYSDDHHDWMLSWFNPASGKNKVYSEVREIDHFCNRDVWGTVFNLMNGGGRLHTEERCGYKATVSIGQANSSILEAIITAAPNAPLDHYEVVFTWAPSYCTVDPAKVACKSGYNENFYLHGMWPMDKDGHEPTIQLPDRGLNEAINRLRRDLEAFWPSLTTKPAEIFWKEQWYKHGCHGNLYPEDYFRRAMAVFKETRLKKYLREANPSIKPDLTKMYLKTDIENAISNGRGRPNDHVRVTSKEHLRTKKQVLYEISICLNSRSQYATCARPSPPPASCLYPPKN